jgi:hypothetical protein
MFCKINTTGMDQSKLKYPGITERGDLAKHADNVPQMHLNGLRDAHTGKVFSYFNHDNIAKNSNLVPTLLLLTLVEIKKERGSLPPVLYLQLDNTCRENKNKNVFAFLQCLVDRNIFRKIKVNFLPTGHVRITFPVPSMYHIIHRY